MRTRFPVPHAPRALAFGAALVLVACGDDGIDDSIEVGGGAGDAMENAAVLAPFAGTWDLTGDWRGLPDDEAYLAIDVPDEDGESAAALHDLFESGGCYERPERGTVRVDDFGTGVFMNGVFSLEEALLTLRDDSTLVIEYATASGRTTATAVRNDGIVDFEPSC